MSIQGLPASRDEWPAQVLAAVEKFACGDIVREPPFFYFADPANGVLERTKQYVSGYEGPEVILDPDSASAFGVLTSQTCDIGEVDFPTPSSPFVSVSPVFDGATSVDGSVRSLLKKGRRIGSLLHVPLLSEVEDGFWIADFRIEMPIEKSWFVGREPIKGFSETDARIVPDVLADLRGRPAWADVVTRSLQPVLSEEMRRLKRDERELFAAVVNDIDEVGARSDSMLDPTWIEIAAFASGPVSAAVHQWWGALTDRFREVAEATGLQVHLGHVMDLRVCSVMEYRTYAGFPLGRFSPA